MRTSTRSKTSRTRRAGPPLDRVKIVPVRLRVLWILGISCLALAQQQQTQQQPATPPPSSDQSSTPLFTQKISAKSGSAASKDSATLGFNGIDPSGKVDQKMLATEPTDKDREQVKKMSEEMPKEPRLKQFLTVGGLNEK
jgi:hypothetical protein